MEPDYTACVFCGEQVLAAEKKCRHCGERLVRSEGSPGDSHYVLSPAWHAAIWLLIGVPLLGPWLVVILSSSLYCLWRKESPARARAINRSGWTAWFLGNVVWCLVSTVLGSRY